MKHDLDQHDEWCSRGPMRSALQLARRLQGLDSQTFKTLGMPVERLDLCGVQQSPTQLRKRRQRCAPWSTCSCALHGRASVLAQRRQPPVCRQANRSHGCLSGPRPSQARRPWQARRRLPSRSALRASALRMRRPALRPRPTGFVSAARDACSTHRFRCEASCPR